MKISIQILLACICAIWQPLVMAEENNAVQPVRMEKIDIPQLATGRPSKINMWFPQGNCENLHEQLCLAQNAITHHIIVFSHGAMGSAIEYNWLAEGLATAGYIVVGVNHFGESWVYDKDSQNPRTTGLIWQRAQDISAVLDYLSAKNIFQININWNSVIAIGHSAGGQTATMLAGARFELKQLSDYCSSEPSKNDLSCEYSKESSKAPDAYRNLFAEVQTDTRIRELVLLDPALGPAAVQKTLQEIQLPTLVIGAEHNNFLPWEHHGKHYANEIPHSTVFTLKGQEGHFIFLSPCEHTLKVMGVALCEDAQGVDRKQTHRILLTQIIEFIQQHASEIGSTGASTPYHKPFNTTNIRQQNPISFIDIIAYTPKWVFGLLGVLFAFGLLQTRTRQVHLYAALILPVTMLALSLTGLIGISGFQLLPLFCWILGITSSTYFYATRVKTLVLGVDKASKKITINGSWSPLIVILIIFCVRYFLNVCKALQLDYLYSYEFLLPISFLMGACSGFFVGRGVLFYKAQRV